MKSLFMGILFSLWSQMVFAGFPTQEFIFEDGRSAILETDLVDPKSPWLVYLPGSGCGISAHSGSLAITSLRSTRILNLLLINKTGVPVEGGCRNKEYERSSLRDKRILDVLQIMKQVIPPNSKIIILGFSEGGYIAADVALYDRRSAGLIMFSGGTRSWLEEELMQVPVEKRQQEEAFINKEIIGNYTFEKRYHGWTYAELNSYNTHDGYHSLRNLKIPVLAFNGGLDSLTWVEGTAEDMRQLTEKENKKNIKYYIVPEGNHGLGCGTPTCDQKKLNAWLVDTLVNFIRVLK